MLDVFFDKWWRLGGAFGILYLVLFIAGISVQGEPPQFDKPVDEIRDWFADNGEQHLAGGYMIGLAFMLFFLPFLASLRGLLAAAEGGAAVWSRVAFAGGLLFLIMGATASVFWGALAFSFGVVEEGDKATIRTLVYLDHVSFSVLALVLAPFLLASSLVILRTGVLWRWLVVPGLLAGVLGIIGGASNLESDPEGLVGGLGFLGILLAALWILLVSINMILKKELPAAT